MMSRSFLSKHKYLRPAISMVVFVLLVSSLLISFNQAAFSQEKATLRLLWFHQAQFAGVYYAYSEGYFREEGIDLTIQTGGPEIDGIKLVASGAEQFGITSASQILQAREKGIPVVAVAIIYQGNPTCFFAKESAGIKTPKDWVGKTVGVKYGLELEYYYRAILENQGIEPKSVNAEAIQFDMARFFEGKVDVWCGYTINEPNIAIEQGFPVTIISPDDYGVKVSGDTIFTTEKILREKPQLVQGFINALLKGWQEALVNRRLAINKVREVDGQLKEKHETRMLNSAAKLIDTPHIMGKIGWMTEQQWSVMHGFLKEYGLIKKDVPVSSAFNNRFVNNFYSNLTAGASYVGTASVVSTVVDPPTTAVKPPKDGKDLLGRVYFVSGGVYFTSETVGVLAEVVVNLQNDPQTKKVLIEGHTDSDGSDAVNQRLSEFRANQVADALVKAGISRDRLLIRGYGESDPIASNGTSEGKKQNRRVEIRIQN
jgi:NitT/TauT family transport system substrate-binding protein